MTASQIDGVKGLTDGTDLVDFDQNRVGYTAINSLLQTLGIGHEKIVAHKLDFASNFFGQHLPAVPIIFCQAIFE